MKMRLNFRFDDDGGFEIDGSTTIEDKYVISLTVGSEKEEHMKDMLFYLVDSLKSFVRYHEEYKKVWIANLPKT